MPLGGSYYVHVTAEATIGERHPNSVGGRVESRMAEL